MNTKKVLLIIISLFLISIVVTAQESKEQGMDEMWGESKAALDALKAGKGKLFDEGNFGMFIHWGLYSSLGGVWKDTTYYGIAEWMKNKNMAGIPDEEYIPLAQNFNPVDFNAKKITQLAKDAGMKYIIITSKHHEGFAMFKSQHPFNIVDATPFARDPMKELSAACHDLGLGFGFYYSHNQDWTAPGGSGGPGKNADGTPATFEDYFYNKCLPQVKEICTQYGELDFVWFDTPGRIPKDMVVELHDMVRELQPNAMLCSRIGHGMGDYASKGDMEVPPRNIPGLWETCDTNNDSWAFAWYDNNFKSPKEILFRLISTVARGGTYLFNVGPDGKGNIPVIGVKFLQETGKWIQKYPQVVYAADPSPWSHRLSWGDATKNGNKLFLSIYDWPTAGKLYVPGLKTDILSVNLLKEDRSEKLSFTKNDGWVILDIPYVKSDEIISVIELEFSEEPKAESTLSLDPTTPVVFSTHFAEASNCSKHKKSWMEKFGEWKHIIQVDQWEKGGNVVWDIDVFEPGYYMVKLKYAGTQRSVWSVATDENITIQNQQNASSVYTSYDMGWLQIKGAGKHQISVSLIEGDFENTSLESIELNKVE